MAKPKIRTVTQELKDLLTKFGASVEEDNDGQLVVYMGVYSKCPECNDGPLCNGPCKCEDKRWIYAGTVEGTDYYREV